MPKIRWVNRDLAIGFPVENVEWQALRASGVRAVVDVSDPTTDLGLLVRRQGMRYLRLPVAPGRLPDAEELHIVSSWILQRIAEEGPVLIHDTAIAGNDALIAATVLIKRGAGVRRAVAHIVRTSYELSNDQLALLDRVAGEMATVASRR
jgi:hypothetical protein